jgi:hypothetical protein
MSLKVRFANDVTNAEEEARGSDGRLNVSSRQDSRAYYNSRDDQLAFSVAYNMTGAATGEYVVYWRNASPDKQLVIHKVTVGCGEPAKAKLWFVTGTAASGTELTPVNQNKAASRSAPDDSTVMAMEGNGTTPISGLSTDGLIDIVSIDTAQGMAQFSVQDEIRLGQGDAIAIEMEDLGADADTYGVILGYYE